MKISKANVNLRFNLSDWLIGIDWFDKEMRSWGPRRMVCVRFLCLSIVITWGWEKDIP
jgi:hypothetical protein